MSFDKIVALYIFCADYHSGQNSRGYRILNKLELRYSPSITDSAWKYISTGKGNKYYKLDWEHARSLYLHYARKYGRKI